MRLIDADDFKKKYCEENCEKRKCVDAMDKCNFILSLEEQPTAYDIEKVVKKLGDVTIERHGNDCGIGGEMVVNLDDAIEIVKQGNFGTDDVCEWESDYKIISDKYKRVTGCGHEFYDLHHAVPFKYCPYCSKKIKVVE